MIESMRSSLPPRKYKVVCIQVTVTTQDAKVVGVFFSTSNFDSLKATVVRAKQPKYLTTDTFSHGNTHHTRWLAGRSTAVTPPHTHTTHVHLS